MTKHLGIVSVLLLISCMLFADFTETMVDANYNGVSCIKAIDINCDWDMDLVGTSYSGNSMAVWINVDNLSYDKPIFYTDIAGAISCKTIIPVNSSYPNPYVVGNNSGEVISFTNDGTLELQNKTWIDTDLKNVRDMDMADMDGDGDIDVVCAASDDAEHISICWWEVDLKENNIRHTVDNDFSTASSVRIVDLDKDNDLDIVATSFFGNTSGGPSPFSDPKDIYSQDNLKTPPSSEDLIGSGLAWWENDGNNDFTRHNLNSDTYYGATCVVARDIDDDGDWDLVSTAYISNKVTWWENNGSQSFTQHDLSSTYDKAYACAARDIDGDGDVDIASVSYYNSNTDLACPGFDGGTVTWWENNGSESFTQHTLSTTFGAASSVCIEDMDGDGDNDIVASSEVNTSGISDVSIWEQTNNISEKISMKTDTDYLPVPAAGMKDQVIGRFYLSSSTAISLQSLDVSLIGDYSGLENFKLFKSNDDHFSEDDIFVSDSRTFTYESDPDCIKFEDFSTKVNTGNTYLYVTADVALDAGGTVRGLIGCEDNVFCSGGGVGSFYDAYLSKEAVTLNSKAVVNSSEANLTSLSVLKYNDDEHYDILCIKDSSSMQLYQQNPDNSFSGTQLVTNYDGLVKAAAVDMDRDGDKDLIGLSATNDNICMSTNTGSAFSTKTVLRKDVYLFTKFAINDYNNNGYPDVIFCRNYGNGLVDHATLSYMDHANNYKVNIVEEALDEPYFLLSMDADRDGDIDILTNPYFNRPSQLLAPSYAPGPSGIIKNPIYLYMSSIVNANPGTLVIQDIEQQSCVFSTDLDGDSDLDVIAVAYDTTKLIWLENDGSNTYTEHEIGDLLNGLQMDVCDYDGDGDQDIITAGSEISWWENDGNESFTQHILDSEEAGSTGLKCKDMDLDGDLDIVCTSTSEGNVLIYKQEQDDICSAVLTCFPNFYPHPILGAANQVIGKFKLSAPLSSSFIAAEINLSESRSGASDFRLWQSSDDVFSAETDIQLGDMVGADPGDINPLVFDNFCSPLNACGSYYFLSCDVRADAEGLVTSKFLDEHSLELSGATLPSFSNAFLIGEDVPLPVELTSFSAAEDKGSVILTWETATEIENLGFVLQKKFSTETVWTDLASYSSCDGLQGHGNCSEANTYSYTDDQVQAECAYTYRLGQLSYADDGEICWIGETEIATSAMNMNEVFEFGLSEAYPNPFNPSIHISYGIHEAGWAELNVLDLCGKTITRLSGRDHSAGNYDLDWSPQNLSAGIYLLQLNSSRETSLQKILYVK